MPNLVFELGCEELPAHGVARAAQDLKDAVTSRLHDAGLTYSEAKTLCTPRRLILSIIGLPAEQSDQMIEQRGPSESAAFNPDKTPSKALEGFCRGQGIDPNEVELREGYVWVSKRIVGKETQEVLATILPEAVRALTFDKSMRWGEARMRFARPIRWIVAVLDGNIVSFDIEGVAATNLSRGHRFLSPETFPVTTFDQFVSDLRTRSVEPDPAEREKAIREQAAQVAEGIPNLPEALVQENVFLTEWPIAHQGRFNESFMGLPDAVLITAMAKHQRFFPVFDQKSKVTNAFVSIRNSGDEDAVRQGNEWVLNARFNDAQFFFDEDKSKSLDDFLQLTGRMLFQDKLGTVLDRSARLESLAKIIATTTGADQLEQDAAAIAGKYAKADLATGLVGELSSLQGIIGGEYARREGLPEQSCWAIATQYDLAKNHTITTPESRTAIRLLLADQIDKLTGFLGLGIVPKGSSDPFGLRRAATQIIEAVWLWPQPFPGLQELFQASAGLYKNQSVELAADQIITSLTEIFLGRYEALMSDLKHDVFEAAVSSSSVQELLQPKLIRTRAQTMAVLDKDHALVQTMTRPLNILSAAEKKGDLTLPEALHPESLQSESGILLAEKVGSASLEIHHALRREEPAVAAAELEKLSGSIHQFFEETMIMDDDPTVRAHRLKLVQETTEAIRQVGDFTKIVIEGD